MTTESLILAKAAYQKLMNDHGPDSSEAREYRDGILGAMVANSLEYNATEAVFEEDYQHKKKLLKAAGLIRE